MQVERILILLLAVIAKYWRQHPYQLGTSHVTCHLSPRRPITPAFWTAKREGCLLARVWSGCLPAFGPEEQDRKDAGFGPESQSPGQVWAESVGAGTGQSGHHTTGGGALLWARRLRLLSWLKRR